MTLYGIDVASYQAGLNLAEVKAESFDFIIAKASLLILVAYHYVTLDAAAAQADNLVGALGDTSIPVMLDFEAGCGDLDNFWVVANAITAAGAHVATSVALRRLTSARGAEDLDREDQSVTLLDPGPGLTLGVAIRRRHRDTDSGPDLLSGDRLLKTRHDAVERELSWAATFVSTVEYPAVTSVDTHIADGDRGRRCDDRPVAGMQSVHLGLRHTERC